MGAPEGGAAAQQPQRAVAFGGHQPVPDLAPFINLGKVVEEVGLDFMEWVAPDEPRRATPHFVLGFQPLEGLGQDAGDPNGANPGFGPGSPDNPSEEDFDLSTRALMQNSRAPPKSRVGRGPGPFDDLPSRPWVRWSVG